MKSKTLTSFTAMTLFAAMAIPVQLAAQEQKKEHHHYKVFSLGSLGGPRSFINTGSVPNFPYSSVLNGAGEVAAFGDTSTPDPFAPNYCYESDCFVGYVFGLKDGVQTNLGVLPQNPTTGPQRACFDCAWSSFAYWISDNGLIAGATENNALDPLTGAPTSLAALWKDGKIINLGTLGGNESVAGAVNRRGDVVGAALNSTSDPFPGRFPYSDFFIFGNGTESHAILWRDGKMHDLKTLGGPDSAAFFVNDDGQVAGSSDVDYSSNITIENQAGGPTVHPFLWEAGKMRDLIADAPPEMFGGTYGIATWLNKRGQVTGTMNLTGDTTWHSFLWDRGVVQDLGTLGGIITTANWLNEAGRVVGKSDVTTICEACAPGNQKQLHHPFLWKDDVMMDLGLLSGDTAGVANSINRRDQIVGQTDPCTGVRASDDGCNAPEYHAFLWENGSMVDLQTLVLPGSDFRVDNAFEINDRGEIIGAGSLPNGDRNILLLIPCDENHADVEGCEDAGTTSVTSDNSAPVTRTSTNVSQSTLSPEVLTARTHLSSRHHILTFPH